MAIQKEEILSELDHEIHELKVQIECPTPR